MPVFYMQDILRKSLRKVRHTLWPSPEPWPSRTVYELFPELKWTELLPEEEISTPETEKMNFGATYEHLQRKVYTAPSLKTAVLPDVQFCPNNNIVIGPKKTVVAESTGPGAKAFNIDWRVLNSTNNGHFIPGPATALRCPFNNHYHLLIDNISRLLLLHNPLFQGGPPVKVLCPGRLSATEQLLLDHLLPKNARITFLPEDGLCHIKDYVFLPYPTTRGSGYIHKELLRLYRKRFKIDERATKSAAPERIYISRRHATTRQVLNEDDIIPGLKNRGFKVCMLEQMTFEGQIDLFAGAECVVGPHGAGLANILFSRSTSVLELFGSTTIRAHYYYLSKALGHKYRNYIASSEPEEPHRDFTVDRRKFFNNVDELLS